MNHIDAQKVAVQNMGFLAIPTIALAGVWIALTVWIVAQLINTPAIDPLLIIMIGMVTYGAYTPLHDATHNAVGGTAAKHRWINNTVGVLMGIIMGIPFFSHKMIHLKHHQNTNHADKDPDMLYSIHSVTDWIRAVLLSTPSQYFEPFKRDLLSTEEKRIFWAEITLIGAARIALIALSSAPLAVFLTVLVGQLVGVAILITLFAWLVHHPHTAQERMQTTVVYNTKTLLDLPITWLWGYQNYHAIHHLYPKIPFYRYRSVHVKIENFLRDADVPHKTLV